MKKSYTECLNFEKLLEGKELKRKVFCIWPIVLFSIMALLVLSITANRTWNHLDMEDPFMGRVARQAKDYHPIVLVGDSVIEAFFKTDKDRRTIAELLSIKTDLPVLNAARSGMTLSAQEELLELLAFKRAKAQVLILEINPGQMMRGTDPQAFAEWKAHMELIKSNMSPAKRFWEYTFYLDKKMGRSGNPSENNKAENKHDSEGEDLFSIPTQLKRVFATSHKIAPNVLCFITPMDVARIKKKSTLTFIEQGKIIEQVKATCAQLGIPCLDFHQLLPDSNRFPDAGYIDIYHVHLDDKGRKTLVDKLVAELHKEGYLQAPSNIQDQQS